MRSLVIVPAYNEQALVGQVVAEIRRHGLSVVVVDDGSTDATAARALAAGATVLRHCVNRGQGAALQTGITFAIAQQVDALVTFDADGQQDAEQIQAVLEPIESGRAEVALGSRFLDIDPSLPNTRRVVLRFAAAITRWYTGLRVTDVHNGFRAFSRSAAERLCIHQDRMAHASELLEQIAAGKFRYVEVPVRVRYTHYSLGKGQKLRHSVQIVWDLFFSRLSK